MILSKRLFLQAATFLSAGLFRTRTARADAMDAAALGIVDGWYLPRTEALVSAFAAQRGAWETSCRAESPDLPALRAAFGNAADAWIAIEHVAFGPLGVHQRAERVSFFPDRRNAVGKAVNGLIGRAAKGSLTADDVAGVSVAGQGLPALERLLYDDAYLKPGTPADMRARCAVGLAIAGNLQAIADAVKAEWLAPDGPRAKLAAGQPMPPLFADGRQALSGMLTDLATGLQRLIDVKIRRFMGTSAETAAPLLAEGVRSGRVKRDLVLAAESLAAEGKALAAGTPDYVQVRVGRIADRFAQRYAAMPDDVAQDAADPARRGAVLDLVAPLRAMQAVLVDEVAPALGVQLGFNSLDGD